MCARAGINRKPGRREARSWGFARCAPRAIDPRRAVQVPSNLLSREATNNRIASRCSSPSDLPPVLRVLRASSAFARSMSCTCSSVVLNCTWYCCGPVIGRNSARSASTRAGAGTRRVDEAAPTGAADLGRARIRRELSAEISLVLQAAKIPLAVVNPRPVRDLAKRPAFWRRPTSSMPSRSRALPPP
jgi:hypothetical protein